MRDTVSTVKPNTHAPLATEALLAALPSTKSRPGEVFPIGNTKVFLWNPDSVRTPAAGVCVVPTDISATDAYIADPLTAPGRYENPIAVDAVDPTTFKRAVRFSFVANYAGTRTGNVLEANANGALATQDTVTPAVGDRCLVPFQTTGADNGIYVVASLGGASAKASFTRAEDADSSPEVLSGMQVRITEGALYGGRTAHLSTTGAITLNTTALTFVIPQLPCVHAVRGVVTSAIADLAAFTVASDDSITYTEGQRLLYVPASAVAGIYRVGPVSGGVAALTRASDWAAGAILEGGQEILVNEGTTWKNKRWFASLQGAITVGTSSPAFYPREYTVTSGALAGTPGVKAMSNLWIRSATESTVELTRRAAAGTLGHLSFETLTAGAGSGAFTITSSGNETSTVDATIRN